MQQKDKEITCKIRVRLEIIANNEDMTTLRDVEIHEQAFSVADAYITLAKLYDFAFHTLGETPKQSVK